MAITHRKCRSCARWLATPAFVRSDREAGGWDPVCTFCKKEKERKKNEVPVVKAARKKPRKKKPPVYDYPRLTDFAHIFIQQRCPPEEPKSILTPYARRFIRFGSIQEKAFAADFGEVLGEAMNLYGRTDPFGYLYHQEHGTLDDLPDFDATLYHP